MLFKSDILNFKWKSRWRGGRKQFFFYFSFLVFSRFLSVKSFLKIWANHFSLLTFEGFKPSLSLFLTIAGFRLAIRLIFLSGSTIWTVRYCQKFAIFKFLFLFPFDIIFYSLSFHPLPDWPIFLIVLHNGVKKYSHEKGVIRDAVSEERIWVQFYFFDHAIKKGQRLHHPIIRHCKFFQWKYSFYFFGRSTNNWVL